ncbi:hypothetical protein EDD52_102339 [Primorskyibacter sedentarius]|uniref:Uncharacterized protein n=1 Tax=Primorskyibacter sedentarius TaxID=745311 RepID=A0A4R3JK13_9RHOB|nr:hypothetical protein [Primorskyibacter sedentarius]TCS66522.1 hypothetical protein EDD52_102339 [Primorskyibacter sedentarius]
MRNDAAMIEEQNSSELKTRESVTYPFWIDAVIWGRWVVVACAAWLSPTSVMGLCVWVLGTVTIFFGGPYLAYRLYSKSDPQRADIVFLNETDGFWGASKYWD